MRKKAKPSADGLAESPAVDLNAGHRDRLRQRFKILGGEAFTDVELLEALLHVLIPRIDTKPIAKKLLLRFRSFSGVLAARPAELGEIEGIGDKTVTGLKVVLATAQRFTKDRVNRELPVLSSWTQLIDYCRATMAFAEIEQFRILFLDKKNRLIGDEIQQKGTVDHTPVYPREVIKRSLELGATAIILVHNHPSGDPAPSTADVQITKEIMHAAKPMGIVVHDHVIVGKGGHASLKALRLI